MKKLIIFVFVVLYANIVNDFKHKKFHKVCKYSNIKKFSKNEKILSLIGFACIKINNLNVLPSIVNRLKSTKEGIHNSLYFLTIYNQKKLIYSFLFFNQSIDSFSFPKTNYILSKIFENLKNRKFVKRNNYYIIFLKDKLAVVSKRDSEMIVSIYKNKKLINRYIFQ